MSDSSGSTRTHSAGGRGRAALTVGLLVCGFGFFPIGCVEGLLDIADTMDGFGLGLLGRGASICVLMFYTSIPVIVGIVFLWKRVTPKARVSAIVIASVLSVLFVGSGFCKKLFAVSWVYRCTHGEPYACYGAARHPYNRSRADALIRRGCAGHDDLSCRQLCEPDALLRRGCADRDLPWCRDVCYELAAQCSSGDTGACSSIFSAKP
jgi:hypothetical protein